MKYNVGNVDRIVRIVAGLAILSLLVLLDGGSRWVGLIGIIPLATGLIRWCPAYSLLGIDSLGRKQG
jgi:hypothetical protein